MKTKTVPCHVCNGNGFISRHSENGAWSEPCDYCHRKGTKEVPMTNADRIRAMSDDELNDFLGEIENRIDKCPYSFGTKKSFGWLQRPAEESKWG